MSTLQSILEKYKAKSEDEQNFMDKHTDNVQVTDHPNAKDVHDSAKKVKKADRKSNRQGYEPEEDAEVYESQQMFSIDEIKAVLASVEVEEEVIDRIEDTLEEASPAYFLQIIDEAVQEFLEEADEEDREILDEMLATEEGYEELIDLIFEDEDEDDDDDDDDECEKCGGDQKKCDCDVIKKNPKVDESGCGGSHKKK